jgi:hypothetical protein
MLLTHLLDGLSSIWSEEEDGVSLVNQKAGGKPETHYKPAPTELSQKKPPCPPASCFWYPVFAVWALIRGLGVDIVIPLPRYL